MSTTPQRKIPDTYVIHGIEWVIHSLQKHWFTLLQGSPLHYSPSKGSWSWNNRKYSGSLSDFITSRRDGQSPPETQEIQQAYLDWKRARNAKTKAKKKRSKERREARPDDTYEWEKMGSSGEHWFLMLRGHVLHYWPKTGNFRWMGDKSKRVRTQGDVNGFIKKHRPESRESRKNASKEIDQRGQEIVRNTVQNEPSAE